MPEIISKSLPTCPALIEKPVVNGSMTTMIYYCTVIIKGEQQVPTVTGYMVMIHVIVVDEVAFCLSGTKD